MESKHNNVKTSDISANIDDLAELSIVALMCPDYRPLTAFDSGAYFAPTYGEI